MNEGGDEPVAIGADGIPGGWVVALCRVDAATWRQARGARELPPPEARWVELHACANVEGIATLAARGEAVVGIDVPLGLHEHGGSRPCDTEARRLLGRGASSVFNPPARYLFPALAKASDSERWREVQRLVAERKAAHPDEEVVASRQSIGILDKVADADAYLLAHPEAHDWLIECHPEVSFLRLNEGTPLARKSTAKGVLDRLRLIEDAFPTAPPALAEHPLAETVPLADPLDALAALWSALRIASGIIDPDRDALGMGPDGVPRDAEGVPMRMVA